MSPSLSSYFLSDLHLFARRSSADRLTPRIHEIAKHSHTMILGGDIFDFKWSTRPSLEHSISDSISWLESLVVSNPHCSFYYLLGNHDAHPLFVSALAQLATCHAKLDWHPHFLRLENCVFLHGDIVDCEPCHIALAAHREKVDAKPNPQWVSHMLYDAAVHARLHRLAATLVKRRKTVLRRLSRYLDEQGLGPDLGVSDVYFGHTHRNVDGVVFNRLTFHNGGASIKGLPFRIIETKLVMTASETQQDLNKLPST